MLLTVGITNGWKVDLVKNVPVIPPIEELTLMLHKQHAKRS